MRINKHPVAWGLAAALAVAAGLIAIAPAGSGPDVLTAPQVSAGLARARASAAPPSVEPLAPDEWYGTLPMSDVVGRCVGTRMQLTRWSAVAGRFHDVHPGPAARVSLALDAGGHVLVTFTGRCAGGLPAGSYVLNDEAPEDTLFGKWVDSGFTGCQASPETPGAEDPSTCRKTPILALSPAPRLS